MSTGICSHCGREASDLKKCLGRCGGEEMYCNRTCQKKGTSRNKRVCFAKRRGSSPNAERPPADWPQHKKICPGKNRPAQSLVLTVPVPPGAKSMPGEPPWPSEVPVRVYRKLDGFNNSGVALVLSDHLGLERLHPIAQLAFGADGDDPGDLDRVARNLVDGCEMWQPHVTSPVDPSIMRLKPAEACFNTEKYPGEYKALLEAGVISDTGKRVRLGYYPKDFPIARIHAPQTDNMEENIRMREMQEAMFERLDLDL